MPGPPEPIPDFDFGSPAPAAGRPASPSPRPSPSPAAALPAGSRLDLENLRRAWEARGLRVNLGGTSSGFSGFTTPATDAAVSRGSDAMELSVLHYESQQAMQADWDTSNLTAVTPRSGRTAPSYAGVWWNRNMVVVVRTRNPAITADVRDAFLDLTTG
jgi:hypothetical protein